MLCPSTQQGPMDTTDWLKAIVQDNEASAPMMMDSSCSPSPSSADFIRQGVPPPPPPPMLERRLRPPHDQPLKCPRCDSTHTKFCYYNNYSLSQPRYFCKTCRRYWTKGGSLRNVPVGGGCRKNKRSGAAKKAAEHPVPLPLGQLPPSSGHLQDAGGGPTELHLSTLAGLLPPVSHPNPGGGAQRGPLGGFVDCRYAFGPAEAADARFGGVLADPRGQFLLGLDGGDNGALGGFAEMGHGFGAPATFGGMSPLAFSMDVGSHAAAVENCQRLALPWSGNDEDATGAVESKPDPKMLSLEWQEQCGYSTAGGGTGLIWGGGVANNHHVGSSAAPNSLV